MIDINGFVERLSGWQSFMVKKHSLFETENAFISQPAALKNNIIVSHQAVHETLKSAMEVLRSYIED